MVVIFPPNTYHQAVKSPVLEVDIHETKITYELLTSHVDREAKNETHPEKIELSELTDLPVRDIKNALNLPRSTVNDYLIAHRASDRTLEQMRSLNEKSAVIPVKNLGGQVHSS